MNETVEAVVMILPGPKKNSPLYKDLKEKLLTIYPVPSQGVIFKTIEGGKGLRSIVNKILVQICAKVGGIPWY